ncbi:hypothetical protein GF326_00870 [Candidatus Bathyarchaeota archaeon]|nr:hypothetical protein [Candidatus Bathyarchaeota archaeon]
MVSFLRQKGDPNTNLKRIMIFSYWLDKHGTSEFTAEDIDELFDESRNRTPANLPRDLGKLQGRGILIEKGKEGNAIIYTLSSDGIQQVEDM